MFVWKVFSLLFPFHGLCSTIKYPGGDKTASGVNSLLCIYVQSYFLRGSIQKKRETVYHLHRCHQNSLSLQLEYVSNAITYQSTINSWWQLFTFKSIVHFWTWKVDIGSVLAFSQNKFWRLFVYLVLVMWSVLVGYIW